MCACDDSVSRTEKFRRSIDGLKAWCAYRLSSQKFSAQNDVFLDVRVSFVLRLTLDKQIGMCPLHMRQAFDKPVLLENVCIKPAGAGLAHLFSYVRKPPEARRQVQTLVGAL